MIWFHVQLNQKILDSIYSKVSRILLKKPQIIICPAYLNDFYNLKSTAVCCDIFSCNLCSHKSFTYRIFVLGSSLKFAVSKKKWYFVTKIVLTVRKNCSTEICKICVITRTICSNSERSEQSLVTEYVFNLFLEVFYT